jgi:hypothetical protein
VVDNDLRLPVVAKTIQLAPEAVQKSAGDDVCVRHCEEGILVHVGDEIMQDRNDVAVPVKESCMEFEEI